MKYGFIWKIFMFYGTMTHAGTYSGGTEYGTFISFYLQKRAGKYLVYKVKPKTLENGEIFLNINSIQLIQQSSNFFNSEKCVVQRCRLSWQRYLLPSILSVVFQVWKQKQIARAKCRQNGGWDRSS